jgi:phosphopentomutase
MTVTMIVLDSVGLGALPDAAIFGDVGAHTLDHALEVAGLELPNFAKLGLGSVTGITSVSPCETPEAAYGRMVELSPGKDTTTGHWEFMGVVLKHPFNTYQSFPKKLMEAFDAETGRGHLGNRPASGTVIINDLGEAHIESGDPIIYTSADSVFQVAAHVDVVPIDTLYGWCKAARSLLLGEHAVARVIARPFRGLPGDFVRLEAGRRDYSLPPPHDTVLDGLVSAGHDVIGIGKTPDIYANRGFTHCIPSKNNAEGIRLTLKTMCEQPNGLVFTNLVEFDSLFGHRRKPTDYAHALAAVDIMIPQLVCSLHKDDVLFFVSDHGNDPTWPGTDHTREYGLLLACGPRIRPINLGTRESFADLGATIADLLGIEWHGAGHSFHSLLR